jgi:Holliday junction resolvase RusA-like endonuclease
MGNFPWWYTLFVNPEPWEVPPFSVGRRNKKLVAVAGRSERLYAYQSAIKEELEALNPVAIGGDIELQFYFWRQSTEKVVADVTNLQKATEDALQGVLFDNDRQVKYVRSVIADQRPITNPCVVIGIQPFDPQAAMQDYVKGSVGILGSIPYE